jgi:ComF family protein
MFEALQDSLSSLIYPQQCVVCGGQVQSLADGVACRSCWAATRLFTGKEMLCDRCGAFFGERAAPAPVFCRKCDDQLYDKAVAAGVYEKGLAAAIIELKKTPALPGRLRAIVSDAYLPDAFNDIDVVLPIPLSKLRKVERGFNQAEIVAAAIAKRLGVPVDSQSLTRKLHTPIHRIGMDQKARELSVRNAFDILRPKLIEGKNVLLVDDILTSGATASNAAKILKKKGAGKVFVFTLARAVMD